MLDLLPRLLEGLGLTVRLTLLATLVAVPAALVAGTLRARGGPLRRVASAYVEVFRGTSALVQLFWVYFALPLVGVHIDAEPAAILVLGLNSGAYGAEIVRGAILAVPKGQLDAATALGFGPFQRLVRVTLPQAVGEMLPPWGTLQIELLKNTSLVSFITLTDLTFASQTLVSGNLGRRTEILAVVLLLYFALSSVIAFVFRRLDLRYARLVGRTSTGGGVS